MDAPPDSVQTQSAGAICAKAQGASLIQVESSKLVPLIVVLACASGLALALAALAWHEASVSERESRMLQYYLLELDARFIGAGLKKPDDSIASKLKEK